MSDPGLRKQLLQKQFTHELLQNAGSKQAVLKKLAIKLINGLQLEIINTVRFNDISLAAGLMNNSNSQKDKKDYILHKIKYIRVLNACIVEYLFSYLEFLDTHEKKELSNKTFTEKFEPILEKTGLVKDKSGISSSNPPDSKPTRLSQIFTKTIDFLESHQLLYIENFVNGLKELQKTSFGITEEPNDKLAINLIQKVIESLISQSEKLKVIKANMKTYDTTSQLDFTKLLSPHMKHIQDYQTELESIKTNLETLEEDESFLLNSVALQKIISFLKTPFPAELNTETMVRGVNNETKQKLSKLINMILPESIQRVGAPSESNRALGNEIQGSFSTNSNVPDPVISGFELKNRLDDLKDFSIYQELLTSSYESLDSGVSDIETYITKIMENVAKRGAIGISPAEIAAIVGGARKKTKRKKQKNNKVSQRKNRIKVKKHASRKFRAKGKSKKGRKL